MKLFLVYLRDGLIGNVVLAAVAALLAIIIQGVLNALFNMADANTIITVVIGIITFILILALSITSAGEIWGGTYFAKKRKRRERVTSGKAILPILPLLAIIPAVIYAYIVFLQNCSGFDQELKVALSGAIIVSVVYWSVLVIVSILKFWLGACPKCRCVESYEVISETRGDDFEREESKTKHRSGRSVVGEISNVGNVYQDWSSTETYYRTVKGYYKHIAKQCIYCKRIKNSKEEVVTEKSPWI